MHGLKYKSGCWRREPVLEEVVEEEAAWEFMEEEVRGSEKRC